MHSLVKYEHVNAQLDRRDPEKQSLTAEEFDRLPGTDRVATDRKWNHFALGAGICVVLGTIVIGWYACDRP